MSPAADPLKLKVAEAVDRLADELEGLSHRIHDTPELAFKEVTHDPIVHEPLKANPTMAGLFARNLELIDSPEDPDDGQAGYGSTDRGNVSQRLPTIPPCIRISPDGVPGHSREFAEWARSPMARTGMVAAAKALALTAVDLLASPEALAGAKRLRRRSWRMRTVGLIPIVASLLVAGCAGSRVTPVDNTAQAELRNAAGQVVATATLTQVGGALRVLVEAQGLPPGVKGVHIHAVGKCDPPDFTSAGSHFNPGGKQHGALNPQGPHAGDLPNLTVGADGRGRMESTTELVTLLSAPNSVFDADGSALVIHAAADDFKTDPTGNSGARIACGVIVKK